MFLLILRISQDLSINLYGSQESRLSADEVKEEWETLIKEMIKIEAKDEFSIVIGDANLHLGPYVSGNHGNISMMNASS